MSNDDLLYCYTTVIRPVTEYACVVWHTSLTKGQTLQLESIQKRALKIIYGNNTVDVSHALNSLPVIIGKTRFSYQEILYYFAKSFELSA